MALLRRVVDTGVGFIDTADSYCPRISESLIAKALYPYPAGLVIATKGGLVRPGPDRWNTDCRPEHLRRACTDCGSSASSFTSAAAWGPSQP
jgi:aryl-alcohol dehydrogenase-like predicted oxidoreductase